VAYKLSGNINATFPYLQLANVVSERFLSVFLRMVFNQFIFLCFSLIQLALLVIPWCPSFSTCNPCALLLLVSLKALVRAHILPVTVNEMLSLSM